MTCLRNKLITFAISCIVLTVVATTIFTTNINESVRAANTLEAHHPLVEIWSTQGLGLYTEFNQDGTGITIDGQGAMRFTWRTVSCSMELLFVTGIYNTPGVINVMIFEYVFDGQDVLRLRQIYPHENSDWVEYRSIEQLPDIPLLNNGLPATISISWWGGQARHYAMLEALDIFMARYPNITIEAQSSVFSGYLDMLAPRIAARAEPDIMMVHYAWLHLFDGGRNVFLDLNTVSHILDLREWPLEVLRFTTTVDGQLAGIPHGITGRVVIYNSYLLEKHGLYSFPSTFDEWIDYGRMVSVGNTAIDAGNNTYAFFPLGSESLDIMLLTMLYNETGRNLQADGLILHTVDEVEAMFNIIGEMIEVGAIPTWEQQESPNDFSNPVWRQGRSGASYEWIGNIFWAGGDFMSDPLESRRIFDGLGVALLPAVTPGGSQAVMQRPSLVYAISNNSNYPEVAAYLLNFLYTDEEALKAIGDVLGVPSARTAVAFAEQEGFVWGLQREGMDLMAANMGEMCYLFESLHLRIPRLNAIEGFRIGVFSAREAAERWVNDQQTELTYVR